MVGEEIFCWAAQPECLRSRNRPWLFCLWTRILPGRRGGLCWRYQSWWNQPWYILPKTWSNNYICFNRFKTKLSFPWPPDFLDSAKLTAMLENQLGDISDFVNSNKGAPINFDNGLPRVDGRCVELQYLSQTQSQFHQFKTTIGLCARQRQNSCGKSHNTLKSEL